MFSRARICANPLYKLTNSFLATTEFSSQQTRNTYILKRKWPIRLYKKGHEPHRMKSKNFVYQLVEDTMQTKREVEVILTTNVKHYGLMGERVKVPIIKAYNKLLLMGRAVYATPENIEKYKEVIRLQTSDGKEYSSKFVRQTVNAMSTLCLPVTMSKDNPWTIEPWHIKTCFRLAGFHVPENAITLSKKPISGPDPSKENKEFYVTVIINNTNSVNVRCRLLHLHINDDSETDDSYLKKPADPIFEEDGPVLRSLQKSNRIKAASSDNQGKQMN